MVWASWNAQRTMPRAFGYRMCGAWRLVAAITDEVYVAGSLNSAARKGV
jgi:hypothetical protein